MKVAMSFGILALLLVAGCATTEENLAGQARGGGNSLAAASCDADDLCETNKLNSDIIVGNTIYAMNVLSAKEGEIEKLRLMGPDAYSDNDDLFVSGDSSNWNFKNGDGMDIMQLTTGGDFWVNRAAINNLRLDGWQALQVSQLNGTGNAYACLDPQGVLFRSYEPCVDVPIGPIVIN